MAAVWPESREGGTVTCIGIFSFPAYISFYQSIPEKQENLDAMKSCIALNQVIFIHITN
jgi:dihydroorotase